ncbi:MAG: hypothetical protein GY754_30420 [bacterium]|nr:hypothetical protein [bacterium]
MKIDKNRVLERSLKRNKKKVEQPPLKEEAALLYYRRKIIQKLRYYYQLNRCGMLSIPHLLSNDYLILF